MNSQKNNWALILGSSSGMGLATAQKLAKHGHKLILIHRDRRGSMKDIDSLFDKLRSQTEVISINKNALSADGRQEILSELADKLGDNKINLVMHSIALGNLRPIAPTKDNNDESLLGEEDFSQTISNMGFNILLWIQDLFKRNMLSNDTSVIGLTSEGNLKAWNGYAAVSAAKCTLESVSRAMAKEFGCYGIRSNIIQAGITETPALKLIPNYETMIESAVNRNPLGRLTTPKDVADVVYLLSLPESSWINGTLIHVDGGEHIS